ncbi:helix-turn-helix domain-containing protein [Leifsonia poae]|uniref:Transcription regulator, AraC family protein n=1 Tax=Leifsonia poae TaxID=110933 RepID=A0A9W6H9B3_9MICO|nr:helix-turn-helix domain-containing protein [Leifsonia poae]GLJ76295.1 putative transcription regulator, AraC family protein [Leifsonia poae]
MIHSVAVPLIDDFAMFEFGVVCEVFGLDRSYAGLRPFDFRVCGLEPGVPLTNPTGASIIPPFGLEAMEDADLIAVPAARIRDDYPEELLDALRRADARGAILLSVCSGAFLLGEAGLLDGRDCTTHWRYADALARRYPKARVDPDVLFVDAGNLITSAGTSSGIDASLHLVRRELGSAVANTIARNMVVPPQRDGGQRQYIDRPVPEVAGDTFSELLDYLSDRLDESHTVDALAKRAHMSTRSFARRFVAETGVAPMQWLTRQRVLHARLLLETTELPIDEVARQCGFSSATLFRHHFAQEVGVAPTQYRRSFASDPADEGARSLVG